MIDICDYQIEIGEDGRKIVYGLDGGDTDLTIALFLLGGDQTSDHH